VNQTAYQIMQNLTGTWSCKDGLTYEFTQVSNTVYTAGNNNSAGGSKNVGFGVIDEKNQLVTLQWADTPNSNGFGNKGVLLMDASVEGKLTKVGGSPEFGIGDFTQVKA
jgi:hypothetical protein